MPPDLPNNQELALKKRARRRLVGAIALVLLMVIVLPMILQDRAALVPQEAIKITMPASSAPVDKEPVLAVPVPEVKSTVGELSPVESNKVEADVSTQASTDITAKNNVVAEENKKAQVKAQAKNDAKTESKNIEAKVPESKTPDNKTADTKTQAKTPTSFTVQVGVYSDMANVKQLQEKLKQAGYKSHVENLNTPKGEKFRIKTANFSSRQEAASALTKIQAAGLPGMVIGNE
jgi:DedD protein